MAASSMSSVCFQVPGEIARSVKRLPDEVQRLAALIQYFERSVGLGDDAETGRGAIARTAVPGNTRQVSADTAAADMAARQVPGLRDVPRAMIDPGVRTTGGSWETTGPTRSVKPAVLRTVLAGLNNFGVHRMEAGPSGVVWKESQPTESGANPFTQGSRGLRKFFTHKPAVPAGHDHNVGAPVQPPAVDLPRNVQVEKLRDRDVAEVLTRPISVQGRTVGMSLHDNEDWSRRERNWASFDPSGQIYASYPYMALTVQGVSIPWAGREAFYVTMHGWRDRVKVYSRSGNSFKEKLLDSSGIARIMESNPEFRRMRAANPDLQVVLVIGNSGSIRERTLAQQLANTIGLTVHAPNGEIALAPSQILGMTALTVYYHGEDAGAFLTFPPDGDRGNLQSARSSNRETTVTGSTSGVPGPVSQASRLRGGAPDLVGEWRRVSSTGSFIRSAKLKRIDAAVSDLAEDRGNVSHLRAVMSAVVDWQKEKTPASDRWEAVERLGAQVREELDAAGGPERLARELARFRRPLGQRADDGLSGVYGDDVFGTRALPATPDFMTVDVRTVPAARMSALLEWLDLRSTSWPEAREVRRGREFGARPVAQGRYHAPGRSPGDLREIPYIQHQIWFGGPLFDDGAVRGEFQRTITRNTRTNKGFTSVLWTDVPREEFIRADRARKPLIGRLAEVAQMLRWAKTSDVLLLNIDELLSERQLADSHPSVRKLAGYARAERLRNLGPGYASSSDATRILLLHLIGGFYNDADNLVRVPLDGFMRRVAESRDGVALIRDDRDRTDISAQISSAANPALLQYVRVMSDNVTRKLEDLYRGHVAGAGADVSGIDLIKKPVVPKRETLLRTGHVHQGFAHRLGYREREDSYGERISALSQMLALGPDLVEAGKAQSWHGIPPGSHDDGNWLLEIAQSAVTQIQRDVINQRGVVNLSIVSDIVDQVAEPQRLDVWRVSLDFAARLPDVRRNMTGFSAILPEGRWDPVPAEVLAEFRSRFPAATEYLPEEEASDSESLLMFGEDPDTDPGPRRGRVTAARTPVVGMALTESENTNALMRQALQSRLGELVEGSDDHRRVRETLDTYAHARPAKEAPHQEDPGQRQAGVGSATPLETPSGNDYEVSIVVIPPEPAGDDVEHAAGPPSEIPLTTDDAGSATATGTAGEIPVAAQRPEASVTHAIGSSTARVHPGEQGPNRAQPSAQELLTGLRRYTAVPDVSGVEEPAVTGVDLFGRWIPRPAPGFLTDVDYRTLTPEQVLHFFDRVDLLRQRPTPAEMNPAAWRSEQYEDSVVRPDVGRPLTDWSPDPAAPPLPESVRLGIPRLWFSIWLGGVPQPTGRSARFWKTLAASADAHRDIKFVHLTEVTREEVATALSETAEPRTQREARVREMAVWAREHGIRLVNVHELYHAGHPMPLHKEFLSRLARRNGPSMAAASDMLRLMLLDTFGAMYMDGNKTLLPGRDPFREAVETRTLFTYAEGTNSAFVAPARHPLTRALLEEISRSYAKDQTTLYRDGLSWQGIDRSTGINLSRRVPVVERTGPFMVVRALVNAGWYIHPRTRLPYGTDSDPHFRDVPSEHITEGSWIYQAGPSEKPELTENQVYAVVADITDTLTADLYNLRGHLDLTAIEDALATLPDPEAGLSAALMYLASREDLRTRVRGYFGHQQKAVKTGSSRPTRKTVEFPYLQVARRFLHALPAHPALIGDRGGWWLLHRRATRAVLLPPGQDSPTALDLRRADDAGRPDDFGLHRRPTDPWSDARLRDALDLIQREPALTETERKTARKVVTNDVAPANRNQLRSHLWSPAAQEEARALTAEIVGDDPLLGLPPDYRPHLPLPYPEGAEARILPLHHGRPASRPVLAAVIRAVVLSHDEGRDGPVPEAGAHTSAASESRRPDGAAERPDEDVPAARARTAAAGERYRVAGGSPVTLADRSASPAEHPGSPSPTPARQVAVPDIGDEWLRAWALSRNWTTEFALSQYVQASGIVGRAIGYHTTVGQEETETEYRRLLRHVVAAVTDARAGAQTSGKGKEREHAATYEYDERLVSRLRAVFESLDMFNHALKEQTEGSVADRSSWAADMKLTVEYVSQDAVDLIPGLDVQNVWLLYRHHLALDRPVGERVYLPGEPYPGSGVPESPAEPVTPGRQPLPPGAGGAGQTVKTSEDSRRHRAGEVRETDSGAPALTPLSLAEEPPDVSTGADAAALVAAFAEEVRPAVRVWTRPVADEVERLKGVLGTPGSRSLVFGALPGSPVWVVNIRGDLRWMTADMQVTVAPVSADGPVLSIDIDNQGRLTGPSAERLREAGREPAAPKTGFCDLTPGADLSRVLGWRP